MQRFLASLLISGAIASLATGHGATRMIADSYAIEVPSDEPCPVPGSTSHQRGLRTAPDGGGTVLSRTGPRCRVVSRAESSKIVFVHSAELLPRQAALHEPAYRLDTKDFPQSLAHLRLRI
jgi:hypothetical protein